MLSMHSNIRTNPPLVVVFINDLMMSTKIESVCNHLGYNVLFEEDPKLNWPENAPRPMTYSGEPVGGSAAELIENLTNFQPALIIFDLGNDSIPWQQWLIILKSSPATRRIPILCFGPHVESQKMSIALDLSADLVVSQSRFVKSMPELIEKSARFWDQEILDKSCLDPLPARALKGLVAFNAGKYYESHEYLEDAWNEDTSPSKEAFKAILQVAVAYYQIGRSNYPGAIKMFLRARQWLAPLPDTCRGINFAKLKRDAERVHEALIELGPEGIEDFDRDLFLPVEYVATNQIN
jgi:predicted metal-dependent hydrolase